MDASGKPPGYHVGTEGWGRRGGNIQDTGGVGGTGMVWYIYLGFNVQLDTL